MKKCSHCKENKNESEFFKNKLNKDGLNYWCKECIGEYIKNHRKTDRGKNTDKKYRQSKKRKEATDKYNASEKGKNKKRKYKESAKGNFTRIKNEAKKRKKEFLLSLNDYTTKFYNANCYYCGERSFGIDRVNNLEGYIISNVVPCCTICNMMKLTQTKEEFLNRIETIYKRFFNN